MSPDRPTSKSWVFVRVLRETVDALTASKVPFLIAGGLAAKAYGKRRSTHDIDLFVKPDDARRAKEVLANSGFTTEITYPDWLYKAFKEDVMVDIIFKSEGNITVDDETLARARPMDYRGRVLPVVPPEILMLMKVFALRDTHVADTHWRHWRDAISVLRNVPLDYDFLYRKALEVGPRIVLGFLLLAEVEGVRVGDRIVGRLCQAVGAADARQPLWRTPRGRWEPDAA